MIILKPGVPALGCKRDTEMDVSRGTEVVVTEGLRWFLKGHSRQCYRGTEVDITVELMRWVLQWI